MSKVFFTADLHMNHEFVAKDRGYASAAEHDMDLIDAWHRHVGEHDEAWVLGDLTVGSYSKVEGMLKGLPGKKRLVAGNHDGAHPMHRSWLTQQRRASEVFDWVGTDASVRLEGRKVRLNHFPVAGEHAQPDGTYREDRHSEWRPRFHDGVLIHGHVHAEWRIDFQEWGESELMQINVGFDIWKRPVRDTELVELMKEYGK